MGKLIDDVKFVVATPGHATATTTWDNATYLLGNAVNVENYNHVTVFLLGSHTTGAGGNLRFLESATSANCNAAGLAAGTAWIVDPEYYYVNTQTSAEWDTWTRTAVTSATVIVAPSATAQTSYVIELDTAKMAHGGPFLAINMIADGSNCYAGIYILSQPRYISAETAPTAL